MAFHVVRTATGPNTKDGGSEALDWQSWDVKELKGEKARIQIVDKHKGQWGHITIDHIFQSDHKTRIIENVPRDFTFDKKYLNLPANPISGYISNLTSSEAKKQPFVLTS